VGSYDTFSSVIGAGVWACAAETIPMPTKAMAVAKRRNWRKDWVLVVWRFAMVNSKNCATQKCDALDSGS
jgi:hypothetical protein